MVSVSKTQIQDIFKTFFYLISLDEYGFEFDLQGLLSFSFFSLVCISDQAPQLLYKNKTSNI